MKTYVSKTKILLYGGAFDPVTTAHVSIAKCALKYTDYNAVWFLPSFKKTWPHEGRGASPQDRINMIHRAIYGIQRLNCCGFEITHKIMIGTYEALKKLEEHHRIVYPWILYEFGLLIGGDNANQFKRWKNWKELYDYTQFVIVPRVNEELGDKLFWTQSNRHLIISKENLKEVTDVPSKISSTMARREIAEKGKRTKLVAESVLNYILERRLYI